MTDVPILRAGFSIRPGVAPQRGVDGRWHVLYITRNPNTGSWYGGRHSSSRLDKSYRYRGSGNWVTRHRMPDLLTTEIFEFHSDEDVLVAAEKTWLPFEVIKADHYCRNLTEAGKGFTPKSATILNADPRVRAQLSAALRGKKKSPDAIAKTAAAHRGKKRSPEACANNAAAQRGKILSPEHVAKTATTLRGRKRSPDAIAKTAAANRGRRHTQATCAKMSLVRRGRKRSPDAIAKTAATLRGRKHTQDRIAKVSAALRGRVFSPQHCENLRQAALRREATRRANQAMRA